MFLYHYPIPETPSRGRHLVTMQPSKSVLDAARRTLLHAVNYHGCGQLAQFVGPSSTTRSGGGAADFYIIYPAINPPGNNNNIRIGAKLGFWDEASADIDVTWNGGTTRTYNAHTGGTQGNDEKPAGISIFTSAESAYSTNAVTDGNAAYTYSKLEVDNCAIAYMSAFTMPRTTANYRADTPTASSFDQQFGLKNDTFNVGTPLLGTNDYDFTAGSAGALLQFMTTRDAANPSMLASTAPCVFQYAHPSGIYVAGQGAGTWVNLFGTAEVNNTTEDTLIRARGREIRAVGGSYNRSLDLAVVARWNDSANAAIKVSTYETDGTPIANSTHTLTTGGGDVTTPTLEVNDSFVAYAPEGSDIKIEVQADSSNAVEIQTIALFERSMGAAL